MAMNEYGQPVGEDLTNPMPSAAPEQRALVGRWCEVRPLDAAADLDDLWAEFSADSDSSDWTYLPYGPFGEPEALGRWLAESQESSDPQFFTVVDTTTGRAAGVASFLRIAPASGSIEVGHIHFGRSIQGTKASTEAMYLMMRHAFDSGYRRYEWKCDALNEPSRRAAARLGFSFEGEFRQATAYKGRSRDTAWFSIVDGEWPAAQAEFERWLDPANFDSDDVQHTPLRMANRASDLAPRLVVSDGDAALDFYANAFGSKATDQQYDNGRLVNGHVLIGSTLVGVTEEDGSLNVSPATLGGTPVVLSLTVADVDAAAARFVKAGGEVLIAIDDRPYGRRDGRLVDPYGHLWILGQPLR